MPEGLVGDTGFEPVTSSVSGKRATAAPIAPVKAVELWSGGGDGIRTRVDGFAGRCLATRPRHRVWFDPRDVISRRRSPTLERMTRFELATLTLAR